MGSSRSPPAPAGSESGFRGALLPPPGSGLQGPGLPELLLAGSLGPGDPGGMERGPRTASSRVFNPQLALRASKASAFKKILQSVLRLAASLRLLWRLQRLDPHTVELGGEGAAAGSAGRTRPGWSLSLWCSREDACQSAGGSGPPTGAWVTSVRLLRPPRSLCPPLAAAQTGDSLRHLLQPRPAGRSASQPHGGPLSSGGA